MILAHQGGWDEALFVVGPLLFIVGLLRLAKKRAVNAQSTVTAQPSVHAQPAENEPPVENEPLADTTE